ncbi:MAG: glycosyltransferase family A protein [Candidatus Binatia bacterium]
MAPAISVIMPTRDRAHYLREAIDSVLAQRRADLELLVVDDGSTDATPAVLAAVADPRLRCLRQGARGIGAAMNTGLRAARGGYVARLDSDDVWHPICWRRWPRCSTRGRRSASPTPAARR